MPTCLHFGLDTETRPYTFTRPLGMCLRYRPAATRIMPIWLSHRRSARVHRVSTATGMAPTADHDGRFWHNSFVLY